MKVLYTHHFKMSNGLPFIYEMTDRYQECWNLFSEFVDAGFYPMDRTTAIWLHNTAVEVIYREQQAKTGIYGLPGRLPQSHYYRICKRVWARYPKLWHAFIDWDVWRRRNNSGEPFIL